MVEKWVDLDMADQGQYLVNPNYDEKLKSIDDKI